MPQCRTYVTFNFHTLIPYGHAIGPRVLKSSVAGRTTTFKFSLTPPPMMTMTDHQNWSISVAIPARSISCRRKVTREMPPAVLYFHRPKSLSRRAVGNGGSRENDLFGQTFANLKIFAKFRSWRVFRGRPSCVNGCFVEFCIH